MIKPAKVAGGNYTIARMRKKTCKMNSYSCTLLLYEMNKKRRMWYEFNRNRKDGADNEEELISCLPGYL
jgi:hypothetical protein